MPRTLHLVPVLTENALPIVYEGPIRRRLVWTTTHEDHRPAAAPETVAWTTGRRAP